MASSAMAKCCSLFAPKASVEVSAQEQVLQGIEDMTAAYTKVATYPLPPAAALVLANIRTGLTRIQVLLEKSAFTEQQAWRTPMPQEQIEWSAAYPQGGILIRRQLCSGSISEGDHVLGGLFISDIGIVFDTGDVPEGRVETGFVCWKNITISLRDGQTNSVVMSVADAAFTELQLQFTVTEDAEWLTGLLDCLKNNAREVTQQPDDKGDKTAVHLNVAKDQLADREGSTLLLHQLSKSSANLATKASTEKLEETADAAPEGPRPEVHRALTVGSKLSGEYAEAPGGRQAFVIPQHDAPVATETLMPADISSLRAKLVTENWLPTFLKENKHAKDISATPWTESKRSLGVMVRKITFTVPVPQDFPRAITRLVQLPAETRVTAIFRLLSQDGDLIITCQLCSHDIPYGDSFRVHETARFRPTAESGVKSIETTNWVEVMWIASLPWTHGVLKSIIDQRTKTRGESLLCRAVEALKMEFKKE